MLDYFKMAMGTAIARIPSVLWAIVLLVIAYVVASIVKSMVQKGISALKLDKYLDKIGLSDEETKSPTVFIGKLAFLVVFLLFIPGIFERLGMSNISAPITSLVSSFLNFIPKLIAAGIILFIGCFVAKTVRQLAIPVFRRLKLDELQKKVGLEASEGAQISSVLAYIVYILILIPVVVAAIQVLGISAISGPAISMLNSIFDFIPKIFVAAIILIMGSFIAKIVCKLVESVLGTIGADALGKKFVSGKAKESFSLSKTVACAVNYILLLLFLVEALNVLDLAVLQGVGAAVIFYLPFIISAVVIMGAAVLAGGWAESLIVDKFPEAKASAIAAKCVIIAVGIFMTLSQLGIAKDIVTAAFIIILSAVAVAFAVAFGIGGREFASHILKKLEDPKKEEK